MIFIHELIKHGRPSSTVDRLSGFLTEGRLPRAAPPSALGGGVHFTAQHAQDAALFQASLHHRPSGGSGRGRLNSGGWD